MEKLKAKHDHLLTKLLKVGIFALVLLLPFFVFMPTAFYYGFNEHAQVEIPQKVGIYETNEVNSINDLQYNKIYHIDKLSNNYLVGDSTKFKIAKCTNIQINSQIAFDTNVGTYVENYSELLVEFDSDTESYFYLEFYNIKSESTYIHYDLELVNLLNVDFIIIEDQDYPNSLEGMKALIEEYGKLPTASDFNIYEITETTSISENMSNSWENMWNTPIFAWTENSPFETSINGFTSIFNISQESGIDNLLAYIMTISCIYVVIDIVLGLFTWITHTIGER